MSVPARPPPLAGSDSVKDTDRALQFALAEIAALRAELARVAACDPCRVAVARMRSNTSHPHIFASGNTPEVQIVSGDGLHMNRMAQQIQLDTESACNQVKTVANSELPRCDSSSEAAYVGNAYGESKEMLSHCSDISGSHKFVANNLTPTLQSSLNDKTSLMNAATTTIYNSKHGNKLSSQHGTAEPINYVNDSKKSGARVASGGVKKSLSRSRKDRSSASKPKIPGQSRYWTPEEHKLFLEALNKYGHKDLKSISAWVGTRNMTQVRTHSQKYFMRLMREAKRQNPIEQSPKKECESFSDKNDTYLSEIGSPTSDVNPQSCVDNAQNESAQGKARALVVAADGANGSNTQPIDASKQMDSDKYSVPSTCGMMLLCLVGQDTLTD